MVHQSETFAPRENNSLYDSEYNGNMHCSINVIFIDV